MGLLEGIFPKKSARKMQGATPGKEAYIVKFGLAGKPPAEKVKFCQALFGRKEGTGLLGHIGGKKLGNGCVLVPADSIGMIEAFMGERKVRMQKQKIVLVE